MNTLFASRPDKVLPRFEDLTMDVKGSQREARNRPDVLTNRDIEAEILAQLARRIRLVRQTSQTPEGFHAFTMNTKFSCSPLCFIQF